MDGLPLIAKRITANDHMRALAYADSDEPIAFFCECGERTCFQTVWLSPAAFDRARELGSPLLAEHMPRPPAESA